MELTAENYFSLEADRIYMSVSQYSAFLECEKKAYLRYVVGSIKQEDKKCFSLGHLVHSFFEGKKEFKKLIHDNLETYTYEKGKGLNKKRNRSLLLCFEKEEWKATKSTSLKAGVLD